MGEKKLLQPSNTPLDPLLSRGRSLHWVAPRNDLPGDQQSLNFTAKISIARAAIIDCATHHWIYPFRSCVNISRMYVFESLR